MIQTSFAAGELAPSIFARTDLATYHQGLALCRNFFVDYRSGVSTRQGTKYVLQCKSPGSRLVSFSVSTSVNYIVEFGNFYCRFYNNGAPVLEAPFNITGVTLTPVLQITVPGNNFALGDWIFVIGTAGVPQIAGGRFFIVSNVVGSLVTLTDLQGAAIDSSAWGTYTSGGTASRVYTIPSPYAASDLFPVPSTNPSIAAKPGIKFAESVSVLYITHPNYPPTTLTFAAPTNWYFTTLSFGATIDSPTGATVANVFVPDPGSAASGNPINGGYVYAVTAVDLQGQESVPNISPQFNTVGTGFGGNLVITQTAGTLTFVWNGVAEATSYNIYRTQIAIGSDPAHGGVPTIPPNAMMGFLGTAPPGTGVQTFIDTGITPDFSVAPPIANLNPFNSGNNPGAVSFFQQRLYYAGSNALPATFWASQPGAFQNFNQSDPVQASDTITGTIVSSQLNQIKHMVPMPGGLIILTGRAAFTLTTGQGANATLAVTPLNATVMPQAYNGCSDVPPLVINEDIIYVQAKGSIVRDLSYNIYAAIYTGTDISVRSNHLFFEHNILQWAYAEEPFKLVYAIRDDGILLSLTFMKEQQIYGWAHHDTQGLFTSVASIQEGQVDAPYVIVQRTLPDGVTQVQWIERVMERTLTYGAEDSWSVDAGIRSNLLPGPVTLSFSSGSVGPAVITSDSPFFNSGSPGFVIRAGGGIAIIVSTISPVAVSVNITQAFPITPDNTPPASASTPPLFLPGTWTYALPATQFFGLDYLIGQTVSINADGGVVTPQVVASDGSITLSQPASKVTAGLGFIAQGQTMPLDVGEPTVQGKRKKIAAVTFKVANTRGLYVGRTQSTLVAFKDMNNQVALNTQIPLVTGDARIVVDALYDPLGQYYFQVTDPLPATVLGVVPEVVIGDTK